ncbi:hypothetical protein [Myceligenerans pegani]|uniref:EfeO-type cupredoxin-like domain-containing protein n=1 Tax=Myceligenerans pegani TaxID=2776917 RepID=A0ABR9MT94_9MICO|nr:hypothetical protein [Myceligenerans sp. TRM 65318]MBE1874118.1 hypothetical protein [Myceligenerans sp. TRM 65318]MBE3016390.1 hypothetical protein [Myceligenerans sp. TRM 65318]
MRGPRHVRPRDARQRLVRPRPIRPALPRPCPARSRPARPRPTRPRPSGVLPAALLAVALLTGSLLTGCAAAADAPSPAPSAAPTDTLRVGLTEWSIETGDAVPASGRLTVLVTNVGATGHDLVVRGARGTWGTPVLAPGERHELTVTAVPGETLELDCSVSGHHAAGMSAELDVAEER